MRRFSMIALAFLALSSTLLAAEDLIGQLPQGTVLAAQINGLVQAQSRLVVMANEMAPGLGASAAEAVDQLKMTAFQARELRGVRNDGRIILALTQFPSGLESVSSGILLLETADYKALRDSLGGSPDEAGVKVAQDPAGFDAVTRGDETTFFVKRGAFTAVTSDRTAAVNLAKQKTAGSVKASKRVAAVFEKNDVGLFVDMDAVNREYGDAIQQFREQFSGLFEAAAAQAGGDAEAMKTQMEATKKVLAGLFTFVADTKAISLGGSFEKTGLVLSIAAEVKQGSSSAGFLGTMKPAANQFVAQLPEGSQMYFEFSGTPELFKELGNFGLSIMQQAGLAAKALEKIMEANAAAGPRNSAAAVSIGKGFSGVNITAYDKPAAALDASVAGIEAMAESKIAGLKDVKIERNAVQHRGIKLTKISMKYDLEALAAQGGGGAAAAQIKALVGEELVQWMGANDKMLIQITEKNLDAVKAKIDQVLDKKQTSGLDPGFAEALKRLPAQNTIIMLMDLPALLSAVFQQLGGAGGVLPIPAIEAPKGKPSFVGIAFVGQSTEAELAFWVPVTVVGQMMQMFQGIGGQIQDNQ